MFFNLFDARLRYRVSTIARRAAKCAVSSAIMLVRGVSKGAKLGLAWGRASLRTNDCNIFLDIGSVGDKTACEDDYRKREHDSGQRTNSGQLVIKYLKPLASQI